MSLQADHKYLLLFLPSQNSILSNASSSRPKYTLIGPHISTTTPTHFTNQQATMSPSVAVHPHPASHASSVADALARLSPVTATATKHLYLHAGTCATPGCCNPVGWSESRVDDSLDWPPLLDDERMIAEISRYGILHRLVCLPLSLSGG